MTSSFGIALTNEEDPEVAPSKIQSQKVSLLRAVWERVDVCDEHLHGPIIPLPLQTILEGSSDSKLYVLHSLLCDFKHLHNLILEKSHSVHYIICMAM